MATINNGESGSSVRTKLNDIINKVEGVTSINNDIKLGDNDKAIFGAGSDLQIFHDGSNSIIAEVGTGGLFLSGASYVAILNSDRTEYMLNANQNGSLQLYYDGSKKLDTTSIGVDVTGTVTADGLQVTNTATTGTNQEIASFRTASGGGLVIRSSDLSAANPDSIIEPFFGESLKVKTSGNDRLKVQDNGDISFYEDTGTTPKFFWDASAESLGIGTSSPSGLTRLTINGAGTLGNPSGGIVLQQDGTDVFYIFNVAADNNTDIDLWNPRNGFVRIGTNNTERLRIDASGSLLVGKTSSAFGTAGIEIDGANDRVWVTRSGAEPLVLNRLTNDGNLLEFYKDGTTVGSIGTVVESSTRYFYISGSSPQDCGIGFYANGIYPSTASGNFADNQKDLGSLGVRWDDVYATNALIQTSDRNEKQDIAELDEAERRVAVAAKGLIRKFRWKDAVAEKGDDARIHFGIIAQDLQAAFEAEGLDAGKYAMFIHSTWTDEETGEERSRMGVRYSELLAFIITAI